MLVIDMVAVAEWRTLTGIVHEYMSTEYMGTYVQSIEYMSTGVQSTRAHMYRV